jgi:hypothetical protein
MYVCMYVCIYIPGVLNPIPGVLNPIPGVEGLGRSTILVDTKPFIFGRHAPVYLETRPRLSET